MIVFQETSFKVAKAFHRKYHRHLKSLIGHKFSIAAIENNKTLGIVTVGRPISRILDNGKTLEITRLTSLGSRNLCSQLYSKAIKECKNLNYEKVITYTRIDENGSSVKASNFKFDIISKCKQWTGRKQHEIIDKIRWVYFIAT